MENQNQQSQIPPSPNQMPSSINTPSGSKVIPLILVGVVGALIAIGAYVLSTKQSQRPLQNIVPTPISSQIPTGDETANWKTYANTKYNFTFKYPVTWQIEEVNDNRLKIIRINGTTDNRWNYDILSWYINYQDLQNDKGFIYDSKLQKWEHLTWKDQYNPTGSGKFTEFYQLFTTETGNPVYCKSHEGGANQLIPLSTKLFIVIDMGQQRCIQNSTYPPPEDKIYKIIQSFNLIQS